MENLLKKIDGNLIEIKSKQDRDTFHISGGEGNTGQLNNYNFFFNLQFDWIFKNFKNENLKFKQFLFLFFSKSIFLILLIGLFLLPLFSINKHNISFFEFGGMIVIFIFLSSWLWNQIKIQGEVKMEEIIKELKPLPNDISKLINIARSLGIMNEISSCNDDVDCIRRKINAKIEKQKSEELLKKKKEIEEDLDEGISP